MASQFCSSIKAIFCTLTLLLLLETPIAQEFTSFRGNNQRQGRRSPDTASNDVGRAGPVWVDPDLVTGFALFTELLPSAPTATSSTSGVTFDGSWQAVDDTFATTDIANNYVNPVSGTTPSYYFVTTVAPGATANTFAWNFFSGQPSVSSTTPTAVSTTDTNVTTTVTGQIVTTETAVETVQQPDTQSIYSAANINVYPINGGDIFEIYVNVPLGSTNGLPAQRFFTYDISGIQDNDGNSITQTVVLDTQGINNGYVGGYLRLGGQFQAAGTTGQPITSPVTVTLKNTFFDSPLNPPGTEPGNTLVYAGGCILKKPTGYYIGSPVVAQLNNTASTLDPWRVVAAKNEFTTTPDLVNTDGTSASYGIGIVSSYLHDGTNVSGAPTTQTGAQVISSTGNTTAAVAQPTDIRRNLVWSWPVARPFTSATTDLDAYDTRKINFINSNTNSALDVPVTDQLKITATPIMTTVSAGGTSQDVVIVAREDGTIFCLDASGDEATGTTSEVLFGSAMVNENGVSFGTSSPLVQTLSNGNTIIFIGASDGSVYGVNIADGTFPAGFPVAISDSAIEGSVAFASAGGFELIIVPTIDKGIVALNAASGAIVWQFPLSTAPAIGEVTMTPAIEFGNIYFGDSNGNFYALDIATGVSTVGWATPFQAENINGVVGAFEMASPATVPAALVPTLGQDVVYATDSNNIVYAIPANSSTQAIWTSNGMDDLGAAASGSITFTVMTLENNTDSFTSGVPVLVIPTLASDIVAMDATDSFPEVHSSPGNVSTNYNPSLPNPVLTLSKRFGPSSKNSAAVGGGVTFSSTSQASFTWMYMTDLFGFLYAFTDRPPVSTGLNFPDDVGGTTPPGAGVTPPQGPQAPAETEEQRRKRVEKQEQESLDAFFKDAKIGFLTPWDYDKFSKKGAGGKYNIQEIDDNSEQVTRRTFEFGEKIYVAVYVPVPPDVKAPELELSTGPLPPIKKKPVPLKDGQVYLFDFQADCMYVAKSGKNQRGFSVGSNNLITLKSGKAAIRIPESKRRYTLAHPLGISLAPETGGKPNSNPRAALGVFIDLSEGNKSLGQVERNGAGTGFVDKETKKPLTFRQYFSQDGSNAAVLDPEKDKEKIPQVAHGKTANAIVYAYDRSLMTKLGKPIDVSVLTHNLKWVLPKEAKPEEEPEFGITNPLPQHIYKGYEDTPGGIPAGSADYPDISRTAIKIYNRSFDSALNASRVVRSGPGFPSGAIALPTRLVFPKSLKEIKKDTPDSYEEYNKYAVKRELVPTKFDFQLNVPTFQPPSEKGYEGANFQFFINPDPYRVQGRNAPQPIFRPFTLRTYVAEDANIEIETPIIDFGSMPAGAGFGKSLAVFPSFSRPFKIRNIGNVNLLNIHVLEDTEKGPMLIYGEGMDPNAAISVDHHALSNISEPYLTNIYNEQKVPSFGNTLILQKPRVGDKKGRLLEIPPRRRANAKLTHELKAPILDNTGPDGQTISPVLPQVTIRLPIGTPVGIYKTPFMIADDSLKTPKGPDLHFRVTETKLTNTAEQLEDTNHFFMQPMVDLMKENKRYAWSNVQPTGIRDQAGNLVIAWASNRLNKQGVPSFLPSNIYVGAKDRRDLWRVYLSTLVGAPPKTAKDESPLNDLDAFQENPNGIQWFRHVPVFNLDAEQERQLFGGDVEIIQGSQSYNGPIFSAGLPDHTIPVSGRYMAFLIDAEKRLGQSQVVHESRICLARLNMADIEAVQTSILPSMHLDIDMPTGIPINDPFSTKSRPSLIQVNNHATLFYAASTTGGGQLRWNTFNGTRWSATGILPFENSMESVDAPSTVIRPSSKPTATVPNLIDLVFSARLRGRAQSELFYLRLAANAQGVPVMPTDTAPDPLLPFSQTQDLIKFEPKTATYWAPGAIWRILAEDIDEHSPNLRVDLLITDETGQTKSILDYQTKNYNPGTGTLSFNTIFGGKAYLDTIKGSIQFSDALIPQDQSLMIQYTPRIYRLTAGTETDQDHRSPTLTYDQTQSRFILTYTKVSESSSQGNPITSRPYLRTKKWGIELPIPINTTKGHPTMLHVLTNIGTPIDKSQYIIDLPNNRIYFKPTFENQIVTIEYQAAGQTSSDTPVKLTNKAVRLIEEKNEFAIPISHPVNEIGLTHTLDPIEFQRGNLRPRLIWMLWSSTRSGSPDLYLQTMAPLFDFNKSQ